MNIFAIIPARGGSKGVPGKNIKLLKGYPVIAYSIIAAKLSNKINRIIVSTDNTDIAEISKKFGAEVPFLRPSEFAGDASPDYGFMKHAVDWFEKNENILADYFVHLRPTTPLRKPEILDQAINYFISRNGKFTSMRSAHKCSESPFKWFIKNHDMFDSMSKKYSADEINNPRQAFPEVFIPDGYVDVVIPEFIKKEQILHGNKILAFESPVCSEIDNAEDFEYLEFQIEKKSSELYNYLKLNYPSGE